MNPEEIRRLLLSGDITPPFEIVTTAGRTYRVASSEHLFAPESVPGMIVVAVPGRGLALVRLEQIAAIEAEHEPAAAGRGA